MMLLFKKNYQLKFFIKQFFLVKLSLSLFPIIKFPFLSTKPSQVTLNEPCMIFFCMIFFNVFQLPKTTNKPIISKKESFLKKYQRDEPGTKAAVIRN